MTSGDNNFNDFSEVVYQPEKSHENRQDFFSFVAGSGLVRVCVVEFGTGPTRLCGWSGLVVSFVNSTTRTGPDQTCPRLRPGLRQSGPWQIPLPGPTDFVCDPTRSDPRTKSVHVEIERTSLRPDKVRGCVRRSKRSGSGLVGSV